MLSANRKDHEIPIVTAPTVSETPGRAQAALALAAVVPAPSLGLVAALYLWPDSAPGQLAYAGFKLWLLALPVVWLLLVERRWPRLPRPSGRGMVAGVATGVMMFVVIVGAYALFGGWIDPGAMARQIEAVGLGTAPVFLLGALYWCTVNSILEEYVWRWFVFTRCEALMPRVLAAVAAGFFFTVHHVIALAFYFDWRVTLLGSLGVFIGGTTWSWLYLRWRNIYAAYVSHVFADLAVFGIGWYLVFGNGAA
jgi:membrane protease YdiL (CAAX protease family)